MEDLLAIVTQSLAPKNVGILEFSESDEFSGKALYPRQAVLLKLIFLEEMTGPEEDILTEWMNGGKYNEIELSPNIRERRDYLRDRGYKHFREINLIGGRRSSKGFITGLVMAKKMYSAIQLGDPHGHYGIDRNKEILFPCIAASESQAKDYQYADFVSTVEGCKAMSMYLQRSLETEFRVATPSDLRAISAAKARGGQIQRDITKLKGKALAANADTLRGLAAMVFALDEVAWMVAGESKASADRVYTAALPSLNQFSLDGMMLCNSSPATKVGKFYEIYEVGMRPFKELSIYATQGERSEQTDPRGFSFRFPSWALFEGYVKYKTKWKKIPRGREFGKMITVSPDWDPEEVDADGDPLYSREDQEGIISQRTEEAKNPESFKVEQRGKFAEVIDAFLNPVMVDRMYAGIPESMELQLDGTRKPVYTPLYSHMGQRVSPLYRYKFHLDPSSTTAGFGFGIAHIEMLPDPATGEVAEHVIFDLIKRWNPKDFGGVIRWKPILQEVKMYAEIFRPFEITFDQHESVNPIEELKEMLTQRNVVCQVFMKPATNELNWKRWEVLKTAMYQGLVHAPCDEQVNVSRWSGGGFTSADELKFLQQMPTGGKFPKVEKQDIGPVRTKDMADCIAECVHFLIGNLMATRMRERLSTGLVGGAMGGYGIGLGPAGGPGPPGISGYYSSRQEKIGLMPIKSDLTRGALGGRTRRAVRSRGRY